MFLHAVSNQFSRTYEIQALLYISSDPKVKLVSKNLALNFRLDQLEVLLPRVARPQQCMMLCFHTYECGTLSWQLAYSRPAKRFSSSLTRIAPSPRCFRIWEWCHST